MQKDRWLSAIISACLLPDNKCENSSRSHFGSPPSISPAESLRFCHRPVLLLYWTESQNISPDGGNTRGNNENKHANKHTGGKQICQIRSIQQVTGRRLPVHSTQARAKPTRFNLCFIRDLISSTPAMTSKEPSICMQKRNYLMCHAYSLKYHSSFSDIIVPSMLLHLVHKIKYGLQMSDIKLAENVGFALKLQTCTLIWIIGVKLERQDPTDDKQDEGNAVHRDSNQHCVSILHGNTAVKDEWNIFLPAKSFLQLVLSNRSKKFSLLYFDLWINNHLWYHDQQWHINS